MNKNVYILPVSATFREIKYPEKVISSKEHLEKKLKGQEINIEIIEEIGGSRTNSIYRAKMDDQNIYVKHTEHSIPETAIDFLIMSSSHDVEIRVLKRLQASQDFRVPRVLKNFPKFTTYLMEDLEDAGFESFAKQILKNKMNKKSAVKIGEKLGKLTVQSQGWEEFKTNESAAIIFYERSLELLIAYPNKADMINALGENFQLTSEDKETQASLPRFFVWEGSVPKNMLINKDGDVAFVDFGRSHWGDQQFMPAIFIAHILLYSIAGYIKEKDAKEYVSEFYKSYKDNAPITSEATLIKYLAMEMLHRANGKGFEGIKSSDDALKIQKFARNLIDKNVDTLKKALNQL